MTDTNEAVGAGALEPVPVGAGAVEPAQPMENPEPAPADDAGGEGGQQHDDGGQEADPSDAERPRKKGGFQRTIERQDAELNRVTREKYEAEGRTQQLARENEELRRRLAPAEPGAQPRLEDFTTVDDFTKAHADWARAEGRKEARAEREQQSLREQAASAKAAMDAREAAARQKYPDFAQAVNPWGPALRSVPAVWEYVATEEGGMDMAYHLSRNPAVLDGLRGMTPYQAGRELLKLEARLAAPPPPKPLTRAPDPVKPVGAREGVKVSLADLAQRDTDAYVERRRRQDLERLRANNP